MANGQWSQRTLQKWCHTELDLLFLLQVLLSFIWHLSAQAGRVIPMYKTADGNHDDPHYSCMPCSAVGMQPPVPIYGHQMASPATPDEQHHARLVHQPPVPLNFRRSAAHVSVCGQVLLLLLQLCL